MDDYQSKQMTAIYADLQDLTMKYDSKVLAIVMLTYGSEILRAVQSAGLMPVDDAIATAEAATKYVGIPLPHEDMPQIVTLDGTPVSRRMN